MFVCRAPRLGNFFWSGGENSWRRHHCRFRWSASHLASCRPGGRAVSRSTWWTGGCGGPRAAVSVSAGHPQLSAPLPSVSISCTLSLYTGTLQFVCNNRCQKPKVPTLIICVPAT